MSTEVSEILARIVEAELRPGRIGSVDTSVECTGLVWLHDAYERGLSPMAALIEFRSVPDAPVAGVLVGEVPLEVSEFWELRELACQ
ncbi:hypothetical protein [Streptomyces sp. NBC_01363]|uniref:hypothetical protein n=1 Tax=Streptomyces sp. NBC_01363 TaxID=2903840 RepID=UPI00225717BA|nr:hypothetical protein [Streptomyces sp. NBC_01363]MCX4730596.1 hypothetical protein [Streptomyces sp. NBC_01363]